MNCEIRVWSTSSGLFVVFPGRLLMFRGRYGRKAGMFGNELQEDEKCLYLHFAHNRDPEEIEN